MGKKAKQLKVSTKQKNLDETICFFSRSHYPSSLLAIQRPQPRLPLLYTCVNTCMSVAMHVSVWTCLSACLSVHPSVCLCLCKCVRVCVLKNKRDYSLWWCVLLKMKNLKNQFCVCFFFTVPLKKEEKKKRKKKRRILLLLLLFSFNMLVSYF